jgi:hypothetical protein
MCQSLILPGNTESLYIELSDFRDILWLFYLNYGYFHLSPITPVAKSKPCLKQDNSQKYNPEPQFLRFVPED